MRGVFGSAEEKFGAGDMCMQGREGGGGGGVDTKFIVYQLTLLISYAEFGLLSLISFIYMY